MYELLADGDNVGADVATVLILFVIGAIVYFIPTIVAASRRGRNTGSG